MDKLVLVDGMYEVCKAEKAMGHLSTSDGTSSGLLYGFLRSFRSYFTRFDAVPVVVWDGSPSYRRDLMPDYKGKSRVEDLSIKQVDDLQKFLSNLGIAQVVHTDWEADDVIGTLSNRANSNVLIVTGDHDLFQLITDRINCFSPIGPLKKKINIDEFWIKLNYQVEPKMLPVLWALAGDPSDNIKGVEGIGLKTASIMLTSEDPVFDAVRDLKDIDSFRKAVDVIRIRTDLKGLQWTWPEQNWESVEGLFKGYEFNSFLGEGKKWDLLFTAAKEQIGEVKKLA